MQNAKKTTMLQVLDDVRQEGVTYKVVGYIEYENHHFTMKGRKFVTDTVSFKGGQPLAKLRRRAPEETCRRYPPAGPGSPVTQMAT